ncbi:MAG: hypothetical protein D6715_11620, partial [Calditrichaeota bacterium]
SRQDAREYALLAAKKKALEQAGTYLKSFTRVENYMVSEQEIETLAAGILRTEVLEERTEPAGETMAVVVRIRAIIDRQELENQLQVAGADTALSRQLNELQEEYQRLLSEVEALRGKPTHSPQASKHAGPSPDWKRLQGMEAMVKLALEARKPHPDYARAMTLFQQIPANSPARRAGNGYLGIVRFKQGQLEEAIQFLEKAVGNGRHAQPTLPRIRQGHGRLPRGMQQRLRHEKALFHYYLARALAARGERAQALRHLKLARQLDPDNPTYRKGPGRN